MDRCIAWLFAAALVVAGCTESDSRVEGSSGSALAYGFVVPAGARLVGPVFSIPGRQGEHELAVMTIEDDPIGVYDRFVHQARRRDITLPGSGANACELGIGAGSYAVGTADPKRASWLSCSGTAGIPGRGVSVTVQTRWGGPSHHAVVEFQPGESAPDRGARRAARMSSLPRVTKRRLAVAPGTEFGEENNGFNRDYRRFTLEPGSTVAADAAQVGRYDNTVVLRIHGDAEPVMRRYAHQLGIGPGPTPPVRHVRTSKGEVLTVENSPQGGGAALLITDPTRHWLLIRTVSD